MIRSLAPLAALALLAALPAPARAAGGPPLRKEKEIPLPGKGGFDYVTVDSAARRAYVAHATKVDVVDLEKGAVVGSIEGVEGAHGAIVAGEPRRGFATAGRKRKLLVFDPATLKVEREVETGEGPDALLYVATTKEVWTMNHRAGTVTCVDAASLTVTATIDVGGALEFAAELAGKGLVFVNVEDRGEVVAIDARKHAVAARHSLEPAREPTGLAIDEKRGLLFCGCGSKHLAVVDAATGKVLATPAIGDRCDGAAFDPGTGLAFASCGDGTTTVVRPAGEKEFAVAGTLETAPGARTCTVDRATHELYVVAGSRGKDDVRLLVFAPVEASAVR